MTLHPLPSVIRYGGTGDAILRIYKEEGLAGYFKGMQAKILQTALNAALMLSIKDQVYQSSQAALNNAAKVMVGLKEGKGLPKVPVQIVTRVV